MERTAYRFGPPGSNGRPRFVLRPRQRRLWEDGAPLALGNRAFDLLLALLEHADRVLTRDELFDRVWPGRVVADDNLKMQVLALRKLLGADAVVTVPRLGYRLGYAVVAGDDDGSADTVAGPGSAAPAPPPAPALLGRAAELQAVAALLDAGRLVTIAGPGGIGKTRLAQAAAAAAQPRHADGLVQLDLAALTPADPLPAALAQALQLPPEASAAGAPALAAQLRGLQALLLLDNAEHLLAEVRALVQALLDAAPGVRLLVTSQEPLGLSAETVLRLGPLALPPDDAEDDTADDALGASPAVALFVQRVRRSDPGFALDAGNAAAVAAICRRLDGVPLALELAAARVPLLGAAGVLQHLAERPLQVLAAGNADAPPRQRTMRDALHWSHALLDGAEQRVFRRLGVFVGSFDAELAHAVAGEPGADRWDTVERLLQLVERSLLQVAAHGSGGARWRLLESARAYALEQLAAAGETADVQRRLAEALHARFAAADARLGASALLPWAEALLPEVGHLRAALGWALSPAGDRRLAVALAGASGAFFAGAGLDVEGVRWLTAVQPLIDETTPPRDAAAVWLSLANLGTQPSVTAAGAYDAACRAAELLRRLGDGPALYRALSLLVQHGYRVGADARGLDVPAVIDEMARLEGPDWNVLARRARRWLVASRLTRAGDWAAAAERYRNEVALMHEAGDHWRAWNAAHNAALAEIMLGRPQAAAELMAPAASAIAARGYARRCWAQVAMHALCRIEAGDLEAARPAVADALRAMRGAGSLGWLDDHLAWWLALGGHAAEAARLHGWAEANHQGAGGHRSPQGTRVRQRLLDWLVTALPDAGRRAALVDDGRRLSADEVAMIVQQRL